jgi:hypothetical protein
VRNQQILEKQEYLREIEQHSRLAEGIRTLFISNMNKPIMVAQITTQLGDKTRGVFTSAKEMN